MDVDAENQAPHSPAPPVSAPRKSGRKSMRKSMKVHHNTLGPAENMLRAGASQSRFGFKSRRAQTVAAIESAEGSVPTEPAKPKLIDLLAPTLEALGDLEEPAQLLQLKPQVDKYAGFDAKIKERNDHIKQLKAGLNALIERCNAVPKMVSELQEQVNQQMKATSDESDARKSSLDQTKSELERSRKLAHERGQKLQKLGDTNEAKDKMLETLGAELCQLKERANTAEATLAARDAEVSRQSAAIQQLEEKLTTQESEATNAAEGAAEALRAQQQAAAEVQQEAEESARALEEKLAAAREHEAKLITDGEAATKRADGLQSELTTLKAEHALLKESHASGEKERASLSESMAVTRAQMEAVQAQLAEKEKALQQKDGDLRDAIKNVSSMQRDHVEQMTMERERSSKMEEEMRALRLRDAELSAAGAKSAAEAERLQAELTSATSALTEAHTTAAAMATERDRLSAEAADSYEKLKIAERQVEELRVKIPVLSEKLDKSEASLGAKELEARELQTKLHTVEIEYRAYQEHHGSSNQQQMAAIAELQLTVDRISTQYESKKHELEETAVVVTQTGESMKQMEEKLRDAEAARRELHNQIQELKGNIRVFCRVRPGSSDAANAIEMRGDSLSLTCGKEGSEPYNFAFDKVFNPQTSQASMFEEVDGLVQSALDGYKVCIFAYGQTGSGKTFTMQGAREQEQWGLIPRALQKILSTSQSMKAVGWEWSLSASFLEIYNEQLRDLLYQGSGQQPSYGIKHEEAWGTVVSNMTRVEVSSMEEITKLMAQAAKQRSVGSTDMNAQSSRSHSVFALYLKGVNSEFSTELHGALHLVDLAGSERLSKSHAEGAALKETQSINKSLSALADVFAAKSANNAHTPFRNSKLTHLMEPCLSGQGKTLMLVNVAPEQDNAHETLCSLRFAKQVSQCDTGGKPKKAARPAAASAPKAGSRPATAGAGPPSKRVAK